MILGRNYLSAGLSRVRMAAYLRSVYEKQKINPRKMFTNGFSFSEKKPTKFNKVSSEKTRLNKRRFAEMRFNGLT